MKFAMYKYWTPLRVNLKVMPHIVEYDANSASTGGRTVVHRPWAMIKDLDIRCESDLADLAAKGVKPFKLHPAKCHFEASYTDLDRIAMQKQEKMTFKTNG